MSVWPARREAHLPLVLDYKDARSYILTSIFVSLNVFIPWLVHRLQLSGPSLLPMHFFALTAGLLFGWRAGLITGLSSPLMSHVVSGMPLPHLLPQVTAELAAYGFLAGMLRENTRLSVTLSLAGAMVGGRLALLLAVLLVQLSTGTAYGVSGSESSAAASLFTSVQRGLPGIVLQLLLIPLLARSIAAAFPGQGRKN